MSGAQQARKTRSASRWPDIMVGAITLALLAGFGTLVFGERNKPLVAQTPPPATPVIPASPGTVPEPVVPEPQVVTPPAAQADPAQATQTPTESTTATTPKAPAASTTPDTTTPAPTTSQGATSQALDPANGATAPAQPTTTPETTSTTPGLAQTSEIPPVPKAPPVEPIKPPVLPKPVTPAPPGQATPTPTPTPAAEQTAATTTQPTPATPAVPARTGGAVATSANRVPLRSDYRISLGSFTTRKTVESQTANVRGLGYTVHAIDLGDQYVAQIGPFASEEAARQALADIQRTYPSALLYRPRNATASTTEENTQTSNSSTTSNTSSSASISAANNTETTPAPRQAAAPSGPTYIQVGAFDREESAQRLVGILHDNGFNPTVNSPEGRKTTVMVGPYSGDALLRAEARLDNAGLDHFRVR